MTDQFARAPHRVAEPERQLLAGEARGARTGQIAGERLEIGAAPALGQGVLKLELAVEVILDDRLVAAGDEDEVFDTGFAGLVDHMLDQRPVDHRQHFLRHRLGGGEEAGAEAAATGNTALRIGSMPAPFIRQPVRSHKDRSSKSQVRPKVSPPA